MNAALKLGRNKSQIFLGDIVTRISARKRIGGLKYTYFGNAVNGRIVIQGGLEGKVTLGNISATRGYRGTRKLGFSRHGYGGDGPIGLQPYRLF